MSTKTSPLYMGHELITDHEDDQEPFIMRANAAELRAMGFRFLRSANQLEEGLPIGQVTPASRTGDAT